MASRRVTRKWEVFAGRNRFWCDGRLMTAPQPGVLLFTLALLVGTCALHLACSTRFLAAHVSPALPAAAAVLGLFALSCLLRTALSDPGILPRAALAEAASVEPGDAARPPPRAREVLVRGRAVKLKYCFTCKMFRPPRASHCSLCDNCVERFDHHCPWVGNCVGRRNYRSFYAFVVSLAFLAVFVFACSVTHLALLARGGGLAAALRAQPGAAIVATVCFLSVWSVLGLAGFHTYLASTDQTTNEDIKGSFSRSGAGGGNPYSRGNPCSNCWHVLCAPLAPSLIDRRGPAGAADLPPAFLAPAAPAAPPAAPATPAAPVLLQPAALTALSEGVRLGGYGEWTPPTPARHAYMNHSLDLDHLPLQEVCISSSNGSAGGAGAGGVAGGGAVVGNSSVGAAGGLSASRLRLLHDTTMIDAALDLDDPLPAPRPRIAL